MVQTAGTAGHTRSQTIRRFLTGRSKMMAVDSQCNWNYFLNCFSCYDPLLNIWTKVPSAIGPITSRSYVHKDIIVVKETVCTLICPPRWTNEPTTLLKYNLDSKSWQTFSTVDCGPREDVCLVPLDKYLYAIGGQSTCERRICLPPGMKPFWIHGRK